MRNRRRARSSRSFPPTATPFVPLDASTAPVRLTWTDRTTRRPIAGGGHAADATMAAEPVVTAGRGAGERGDEESIDRKRTCPPTAIAARGSCPSSGPGRRVRHQPDTREAGLDLRRDLAGSGEVGLALAPSPRCVFARPAAVQRRGVLRTSGDAAVEVRQRLLGPCPAAGTPSRGCRGTTRSSRRRRRRRRSRRAPGRARCPSARAPSSGC